MASGRSVVRQAAVLSFALVIVLLTAVVSAAPSRPAAQPAPPTPAEPPARPTPPEPRAPAARNTPADVDGDGYADLVVGDRFGRIAPKGVVGTFSVLYGSPDGITNRDQRWHRDLSGVKGVAVGQPPDRGRCCRGGFGKLVATGDFDGDGRADVAASHDGFPARAVGGSGPDTPPSVSVLYGSARGLSTRDQLMQLTPAAAGGPVGADDDITALDAADFDGDGRDDLLFRSTTSWAEEAASDTLHVFAGSPDGLTGRGAHLSHARSNAVPARQLGPWYAIGDFNTDGRADVAYTSGVDEISGAGYLGVFYGGAGLLSTERHVAWRADEGSQDEELRRALPFAGDTVGFFAVAAGDFDGDGDDDLAAATAIRDTLGDANAGRVVIFPGSPGGLTPEGAQVLGADPTALPQVEFEFGATLAAGDADGDGDDELAVSFAATCQTCRTFRSAYDAVYVLEGTPDGIVTQGAELLSPPLFDVPKEHYDMFAAQMLFRDYNGDGRDDLVISNDGTLHVVYGSPTGVDVDAYQRWDRSRPGLTGNSSFESVEHRTWAGQ